MAKRENYITPIRTLGPYPEELLVQADEYALNIGPEVLGMKGGTIRRLLELALTLDEGRIGEEGVHHQIGLRSRRC